MPRHARLDAPGTLHHVIIRGLERGAIAKDDADRAAFVTRLGAVAQATGTSIYAWVLLPNHAHVLLRSGPAGLSRFMRRNGGRSSLRRLAYLLQKYVNAGSERAKLPRIGRQHVHAVKV